ncbi:unnamed protein product [Bursaphelenchus xylophilus]|uniref:(pine wood nematode) hypothetical protein n=1 Tax=Bursaphelenchus xylophilus TaxID=6326 RepID=A0A811KDA0_BURXY|nr:unnamed protein product [Bursaphelenchus xylophilus]CAG9092373.1 unnamed protein product [Bursaphelenchus xylophilus]
MAGFTLLKGISGNAALPCWWQRSDSAADKWNSDGWSGNVDEGYEGMRCHGAMGQGILMMNRGTDGFGHPPPEQPLARQPGPVQPVMVEFDWAYREVARIERTRRELKNFGMILKLM